MVSAYLFWWSIWTFISLWIVHNLGFSWQIAWAESLITTLSLALLSVAIFYTMKFYRPGRENYFYLRIWVLVIAISLTAIQNGLMPLLFPKEERYLSVLSLALPIRFCYNFLMISFASLTNWLIYYFRDLEESKNRQLSAEQLVREAELSRLRQQLQPHFLFNSLNSISALVGSQPERARHMIQQLSDFLRGTLRKEEHQLISLEEELKHLSLYLDIEKVRFGHRLHTEIVCSESSRKMLLPALLLQPVVENAIKFGLYDIIGEITIGIKGSGNDGYLELQVQNPFDPQSSAPRGTGFGLSSVRRRLFLLYARNDLLQTTAEGSLFTINIKIPQHDTNHTH
jgi:two-component system, LytTR family, sensor kinase